MSEDNEMIGDSEDVLNEAFLNTTNYARVDPGQATKLFTPGCVNGKGPRPSVTVTVNGSSESVGLGCNP